VSGPPPHEALPPQREVADKRLMGLAVALGARHLGLTWPNPAVGAVLVDESGSMPRILAQGATQPGGRPHAETIAVAQAGAAARGATLYVSLEPCSHHGKTPPCAEAIVAAGIARVVTAIEDPDPRVTGRGHAILRDAKIDVAVGLGSVAAARAHRGHISRVVRGRPWVTLKLAQTSDGYAGRRGERLLITAEGANARTHMMRARADAIVVGISTILADDPQLDVRLPGLEDRSPVRVVLDSHLRTPPASRLVATARLRRTWILCSEAAPPADEARLVGAGIEVIRIAPDHAGRVDLRTALQLLGKSGITRLFCEGGPALSDALGAADLLDDIVLITSADRLGARGEAPPGAVPALGPALAAMLRRRFRRVDTDEVGPDRIETFERIASCSPAS
jgi:diaminohydroxyphosphoribosylaminopyrimidine deaminase/5-amino-6-(5-phosphoribosylamino)uracil reductase